MRRNSGSGVFEVPVCGDAPLCPTIGNKVSGAPGAQKLQ